MKVGYLIDHFFPQKGGAERYLADLADFLHRQGSQVHVYCMEGERGELPVALQSVACVSWPRWLREWSFSRCALAMANTDGMDVTMGIRHSPGVALYHPHGGVYRMAFQRGLQSVERPLSRTMKLFFRFLSPRQWLFFAQEWRIFNRRPQPMVVAVSKSVQEDMVRYYGFPKKRIRVLYNGVDTRRFHPANREKYRESLRAALEISQDSLVILFAAHNFSLKGLSHLERALAICKERSPRPVCALVVGRGRKKRYEKLAASLGIEQEIRFVGEVPDMERYYGAADVFVLPTYYDPCSLVVLEALASGLPVITTRFNGASEILTEGREGFVLRHPSHEREMAERILLFFNREKAASMGEAAARLGRTFSLEKNFREMLSLMQEALERKNEGIGCKTSSV